jgi:hypothetical protein
MASAGYSESHRDIGSVYARLRSQPDNNVCLPVRDWGVTFPGMSSSIAGSSSLNSNDSRACVLVPETSNGTACNAGGAGLPNLAECQSYTDNNAGEKVPVCCRRNRAGRLCGTGRRLGKLIDVLADQVSVFMIRRCGCRCW